MSSLLNAAAVVGPQIRDDITLNARWYRPEQGAIGGYDFEGQSADIVNFTTAFWPGGASMYNDGSIQGAIWFQEPDIVAGASSRFGFVGVTRDQYGSPLGGVSLKLFRTSDNLLIDSTTSGPTGNYLLNTAFYPDPHYIVAHKSGSPDVDGVTVNTLIGT